VHVIESSFTLVCCYISPFTPFLTGPFPIASNLFPDGPQTTAFSVLDDSERSPRPTSIPPSWTLQAHRARMPVVVHEMIGTEVAGHERLFTYGAGEDDERIFKRLDGLLGFRSDGNDVVPTVATVPDVHRFALQQSYGRSPVHSVCNLLMVWYQACKR